MSAAPTGSFQFTVGVEPEETTSWLPILRGILVAPVADEFGEDSVPSPSVPWS